LGITRSSGLSTPNIFPSMS